VEETIIWNGVLSLCILGSPYAFGRRKSLERSL